jgi:hypothetical protein
VSGMSSGPIEFINDEPARDEYVTEYGGSAGLIQPEQVAGIDPEEVGHDLTESEKTRITARRLAVPLTPEEAWTGEVEDQRVVDPRTGREVDAGDLADVTGAPGRDVGLSDLRPQ